MLGAPRILDKKLLEARHREIVDAAIEVFSKKGFHNTTVRNIADAARMTQGSLYNYIRSKDEILFLVCDYLISEYQQAIIKSTEHTVDARAQLKAAVRALIEQMHEHQDGLLLIYQESHLLKGEALELILKRVSGFVDYFVDVIRRASETGEPVCRNPGVTANILTFLPTIVALRRWELKNRCGADETICELVEFMMRGLGLHSDGKSFTDVTL